MVFHGQEVVVKGGEVNSSSMYVDVGMTYNLVSFYTHLTVQNLVFVGKDIKHSKRMACWSNPRHS